MIIGKDPNSFGKNNFNNRINTLKENQQLQSIINPMQHSNILDKKGMKEKSFMMLQDRLNKGLISLDEFNQKCKELGKIK